MGKKCFIYNYIKLYIIIYKIHIYIYIKHIFSLSQEITKKLFSHLNKSKLNLFTNMPYRSILNTY